MNDRERTALAYGVAEWANAMDHLEALRTVGQRVPRWLTWRIAWELNSLVDLWLGERPRTMRQVDRIDLAVDEVGTWLVDHQAELDEVLSRKPIKGRT